MAQYSEDERWYRAKVTDLPGEQKVMVKYVDFGNTEILHYTSIRALHKNYITLPQQACNG